MLAAYYPHLVSAALIVAISTLVAGLWAEHRRQQPLQEKNFLAGLVLGITFMIFYSFFAFLLPAIVVTAALWAITSLPSSIPDIVLAETVTQVATLFSVAANFADVASTYGRVSFRRHMGQYCVAILPVYFATMGAAWLLALSMMLVSWFDPITYTRATRLFALPIIDSEPLVNICAFALLAIVAGAVSYFLRKRGEER